MISSLEKNARRTFIPHDGVFADVVVGRWTQARDNRT